MGTEFNYRITGELHLVEDDQIMISSFNRDHIMVYVGLREAGLSHGKAASKIRQRYGTGGGPRPVLFCADEVELMSAEEWKESSGR